MEYMRYQPKADESEQDTKYLSFKVDGTMLFNGFKLPSKTSLSALEIRSFYEKEIRDFYKEAEKYITEVYTRKRFNKDFSFGEVERYSNEERKIIVEKLVTFVREYFYEHETPLRSYTISEMINAHTGECKVMASSLQILLQRMSHVLKSWYVRGEIEENGKRYGHAWVEVVIGGKTFIADPAQNTFIEKDKAGGRYREDDGFVVSVPEIRIKESPLAVKQALRNILR